jgi:hypothetical protein
MPLHRPNRGELGIRRASSRATVKRAKARLGAAACRTAMGGTIKMHTRHFDSSTRPSNPDNSPSIPPPIRCGKGAGGVGECLWERKPRASLADSLCPGLVSAGPLALENEAHRLRRTLTGDVRSWAGGSMRRSDGNQRSSALMSGSTRRANRRSGRQIGWGGGNIGRGECPRRQVGCTIGQIDCTMRQVGCNIGQVGCPQRQGGWTKGRGGCPQRQIDCTTRQGF